MTQQTLEALEAQIGYLAYFGAEADCATAQQALKTLAWAKRLLDAKQPERAKEALARIPFWLTPVQP